MTQPPADDARTCWIQSVIDPHTRKPACLLSWGKTHALLTPEATLATARDLMAAAAGAEADIALVRSLREDVHADDQVVAGLLYAVRTRRATTPATHIALRVSAVAGANTGKPYVQIARDSMQGQLDPDEARQMAQHWTETAVAAQIDIRLRQALTEHPTITDPDIEQIFERMQALQR